MKDKIKVFGGTKKGDGGFSLSSLSFNRNKIDSDVERKHDNAKPKVRVRKRK